MTIKEIMPYIQTNLPIVIRFEDRIDYIGSRSKDLTYPAHVLDKLVEYQYYIFISSTEKRRIILNKEERVVEISVRR